MTSSGQKTGTRSNSPTGGSRLSRTFIRTLSPVISNFSSDDERPEPKTKKTKTEHSPARRSSPIFISDGERSTSTVGSKTLSLLKGPVMQVVVGKGVHTETYFLHKALLSHESAFFRAVCDKNLKDGTEGKITLAEDDPLFFGYFVECMYTGKYTTTDDLEDFEVPHSAKAWALGDKLGARRFKDYAMEKLYRISVPVVPNTGHAPTIGANFVAYCCRATPPSSNLRAFIRDVVVSNFSDQGIVSVTNSDLDQWMDICKEHDVFVTTMLYYLNHRGYNSIGPLARYLESADIVK